MNVVWVQIRSWHALRAFELSSPTLCGRRAGPQAEISTELPAGKSCETCLRIIARKVDAPDPSDGNVGE